MDRYMEVEWVGYLELLRGGVGDQAQTNVLYLEILYDLSWKPGLWDITEIPRNELQEEDT